MAKAAISRSGDRDSASVSVVSPALSRYSGCWFVPLQSLTSFLEDLVSVRFCHAEPQRSISRSGMRDVSLRLSMTERFGIVKAGATHQLLQVIWRCIL